MCVCVCVSVCVCARANMSFVRVIRKEGNILFNDALNTFYLRLYGIGDMVNDYLETIPQIG